MSKRKAQKGMLIKQVIGGIAPHVAWIASNAKGTRTGWYGSREQAEAALRIGLFALAAPAPKKSTSYSKLTFFISK